MGSNYVQIKGVSKWYPHKIDRSLFRRQKSWVKAVDQVDLSLQKGEILGVIGESGCGKSTLGRLLAQLEPVTSGEIVIDNSDALELIKRDNKKFRRMVQIIFQNPFDTFTPRDTVGNIMMRTMKIHDIGDSQESRYDICMKALKFGGLNPADEMMTRYPHELSGGQLQRVAILRSMLLKPKLLIADEPVSMLDVSVRAEIINMMLELSKANETAVLFISHDVALTRHVAHKIAVMYLGRIVEYGPTDQVLHAPQHPYTQVLISNCASIDPERAMKKIIVEGEPPTPIDPGPGCYFAPRCFKAVPACFEKYPATVQFNDEHFVACDRYAD